MNNLILFNSGGTFRKGYSKNKEEVKPLPALGNNQSDEAIEVQSTTKVRNSMSGNSPLASSSEDKDKLSSEEKQINGEKDAKNNTRYSLKDEQLDIIQNSNPMEDDVHTGIRSVDDILTFEEAMANETYAPDFTKEDAEIALNSGMVKVFSSKPIENGAFITPSRMEAENYAGDGKIYEKEVKISFAI